MEHLQLWRERKKHLGLTNQEIANLAELPLRTVEQIMCGKVKHPRLDTVKAIEQALGIKKTPPGNDLPEDVKQLVELVMELSEDEVNELSNFIDYIISKRK
jgi:transcriptional regulator with XRE-family HTH domain